MVGAVTGVEAGAVLVLAAVAVVAWPDRPGLRLGDAGDTGAALGSRVWVRAGIDRASPHRASLRRVTPGHPSLGRTGRTERTGRVSGSVVPLAALAVGGLLLLPVAPGQLVVAVLLAGGTAISLLRGSRAAARSRRETAGLADALRAVIRELRAGAPPHEAAAHACVDAAPAARTILAPYARLGAFSAVQPAGMPLRIVSGGLAGMPLAPTAGGSAGLSAGMTERPITAVPPAVIDQLRRAWAVSTRHGVPLAAVLAACVGDLDDRAALTRLRAQHVAGPAMSGYVLAALPLAGIALGAGMGSHPLDILLGSATGGVLLVMGVGLCSAGLLWSGRIVRGGRHE